MRQFRHWLASGAVLLGLAFVGVSPASAQSAYTTQFVTSITYQNVGSGPASLSLQFYAENALTPTNVPLAALGKDAGTSLAVGSVSSLSAGFKGGAVLLSDQPVVATMVQVPINSPVVNRPLSNGFGTDAGAANFQVPTVLKNAFDQTTRFSVQNVDTVAADITIRFISAAPANLGAVVHTMTIDNLPANSVRYVDAGTIAELGASFNGAAQLSAVRDGTTTAGRIVATALELSTNSIGASSFEGVAGGSAGGSNLVYMPSAICNAFGGQQTAYAVQNTDTPGAPGAQAANVTVTYLARSADNPSAPLETFVFQTSIPAGAKASIAGCTSNIPNNYSGSAKIESTGAKIVAVGKVVGGGITSASPGLTSGAATLALPYVRWTTSQFVPGGRQRTSIAIQNIGSDLAAGAVRVEYYDKNGTLVGTHTLGAIPQNGKANSNPSNIGAAGAEFGYYTDNTFGGSAKIIGPSGSQLVALARVLSNSAFGTVGEDYNAIPVSTN